MEFERFEAPYMTPRVDVASIMLQVLAALVPAAIAHVWYFGPGFLFNLLVAAIFAIGAETLMLNAAQPGTGNRLVAISVRWSRRCCSRFACRL